MFSETITGCQITLYAGSVWGDLKSSTDLKWDMSALSIWVWADGR